MKISVVIATYNRLSCLRANLEFLKNQDYQNYEIIVVNDGSTDKTTSYLKKLKHPHIRVFYSSHLGRSQAKNIGIYQAKGDIIAFIDDDCRAKKNWLSSLVKSFSDPAVVGAIGETRYVKDNYRGFFPEKVIQNPQGKWPMGGNCAFKKEALLKAKGFDVVTAAEGLEGLDIARKEKPDLIVLDVMLPKMDGYRVCRMLKFDRQSSSIPVILLTAKGQEADKQIGSEVKADAYVTKPYEDEKLLETINKLLPSE